MLEHLYKHWWAFALRGVVAILFGLCALMIPGISLVYMVALFAVYALSDGVFNLFTSFGGRGIQWGHLLGGILGIAAGIAAFVYPGMTTIILLYIIALWAIFTGAMAIVAGIKLRNILHHEWIMILMGVVAVLFGGLILMNPEAGALAVSAYIAVYALFSGVSLLILGLKLRSHRHDLPTPPLPRPI